MKKMLAFIFMLTFSISSYSQTNQNEVTGNATEGENMYTIRRNAVCSEDLLLYSYERLLPVSEKTAVALKAGFMIWDPVLPLAEAALVTGGPKNFFEMGVGGIVDIFDDGGFLTFRTGYRYQAPKGFLFKVSAIYSPDNFLLPLVGVGYSF
ncbi:hypothetical protein OU798_10185 [Prolixibacteraceae bacterium Z1-6]|uniref:Outer membrane protein beta-barrel domain-containing protein n=1 Tax=Draconibacterium aestuarii TaxID=2998507 RepID=A0A9X3FDN4_9BACT|nr:hypothetical protein [Prolixibacteraceae bacterium Z1-6]